MLGPLDALPSSPRRIAIAGASGAGKTTLARRVSGILGLPALDPEVTGERWVVALREGELPARIALEADTVVWLDATSRLRLVRRLRGRPIASTNGLPESIEAEYPNVQVVRLRSHREIEQFVFAIGTHRADSLD